VFFEGDTLYDYGHHFILGKFITNKKGVLACFLNSDSYSATTSEHQGMTARAVPESVPTFRIPGAGGESGAVDVAAILKDYEARAAVHAGKAKRARKPHAVNWESEKALSLLEEAKRFAKFFGHKYKGADVAALVAEMERTQEAARIAEVARLAKQKEESADDFAAWKAGTSDHCPSAWALDARGGVVMRIKGDLLQTARGAEVPLRHAVKVFQFVKLCREKGEAWQRNGHVVRVGHFTVDSITAKGDMKAGCHYFTWESIEAAAKAAGVVDAAPSEEAKESK
jgi:hypothetical protein